MLSGKRRQEGQPGHGRPPASSGGTWTVEPGRLTASGGGERERPSPPAPPGAGARVGAWGRRLGRAILAGAHALSPVGRRLEARGRRGAASAAQRRQPGAPARRPRWLGPVGSACSPPWRRRPGRPPTGCACLGRAGQGRSCGQKCSPGCVVNQRRRKPLTRGEATVRARLMAWALPEAPTTWRRTLLSTRTPSELTVVSRGLRRGLGLDTRRQQVPGRWSAARLQAGLPRLRRLLCRRPRRWGPQETTVRAWLAQRAPAHPDRPHKAA